MKLIWTTQLVGEIQKSWRERDLPLPLPLKPRAESSRAKASESLKDIPCSACLRIPILRDPGAAQWDDCSGWPKPRAFRVSDAWLFPIDHIKMDHVVRLCWPEAVLTSNQRSLRRMERFQKQEARNKWQIPSDDRGSYRRTSKIEMHPVDQGNQRRECPRAQQWDLKDA